MVIISEIIATLSASGEFLSKSEVMVFHISVTDCARRSDMCKRQFVKSFYANNLMLSILTLDQRNIVVSICVILLHELDVTTVLCSGAETE